MGDAPKPSQEETKDPYYAALYEPLYGELLDLTTRTGSLDAHPIVYPSLLLAISELSLVETSASLHDAFG